MLNKVGPVKHFTDPAEINCNHLCSKIQSLNDFHIASFADGESNYLMGVSVII